MRSATQDAAVGADTTFDGAPATAPVAERELRRVVVAQAQSDVRARCVSAVEAMPRLAVSHSTGRGPEALLAVQRGDCDLLLLDLDLGDIDCLRLMRRLRSHGSRIEIVAVSGATSAVAVRTTLHAGAIDYIVKPLDTERLRRSLAMYLVRASALSDTHLGQEAIDRAYGAGRLPQRWIPKGLSAGAVTETRELLATGAALSAGEAARVTGLARVTVRRYLEYLVTTGQAVCSTRSDGPGRPQKVYRAVLD